MLWFTEMLEVISMATLHWLILHVKSTDEVFFMLQYAVQWNRIFSINGVLMREMSSTFSFIEYSETF